MKNRRTSAKPSMAEPTETLKEIDQEIARLKERAASIIASEKAGVIERIKEAIAYYSLTAAELGLGAQGPAGKRGKSPKAARPAKVSARAVGDSAGASSTATPVKKTRAGAGGVKYKDDAGNSWSGFGPKPRWLTEALAGGKTLDDLKA
ncbi:H-NS family nucleoid-associated regulatory protein [Pseudorhodoferax soli]|uniref:DNA-binding protein H-NS n=1 Tax=Pseudorhodoferax soli TaxID=545864 RepID=A0A368XWZ4_9BURK|nr:H-NS histone family protein [Pseudorhodoferax soli]RCW72405.1 DNA-binding protein H-NS [Pseudorhodoferax soli]